VYPLPGERLGEDNLCGVADFIAGSRQRYGELCGLLPQSLNARGGFCIVSNRPIISSLIASGMKAS
jgi:hypothetical protein